MADSDWDTVTILRKKPEKASHMRTEQALNKARRQGAEITTTAKYGAASNRKNTTTLNTARLDRETEELKHDKIPLDVGKIIQQGRQSKGWTQKDLATHINEKPQVIQEYEQGKGVPNQQIMSKIERAIGTRLRGAQKGEPLAPRTKKK